MRMLKSRQSRYSMLLLAGTLVLASCDSREVRDHAETMTGGNVDRGVAAINQYGCAACHSIPGIHGADGLVGPPLDRIGQRAYIGGVLRNTPENMITWLQDPPAVDNKTAMPNMHISENDARDIASYLYTLR